MLQKKYYFNKFTILLIVQFFSPCAQSSDSSSFYISIGALKTSSLGAFEQFLIQNDHDGSAGSNNTNSPIGDKFSNSKNPHNIKTNFPCGLGLIGQAGIQEDLEFNNFHTQLRLGLLGFFDFTRISAKAPTGWGVFADTIDAVASNNISASGAYTGIRAFEYKSNYSTQRLFIEIGAIRYKTFSNLIAESTSLNFNMSEEKTAISPIFIVEYSYKNRKFEKNEFISDLLVFQSPYLLNIGLSIGIKNNF